MLVEPEDPEKIFITSDGNAGVKIPASAVDNTSIISITASFDTLNTMLDKPMKGLSGGTRQKVSAALAFMFDADVLILDVVMPGIDASVDDSNPDVTG